MQENKINPKLVYIDAVSSDADLLTNTAFISKQTWGYPDDVMDLWKSDLEISKQYILTNKVVKVFEEDTFIGFFALKITDGKNIEIDHLWLVPDKIKKGYGKQIFPNILDYVKSQGYQKVSLMAEPNVNRFYDKMGGKVIGQFQSKISGRFLDIYEYEINNDSI